MRLPNRICAIALSAVCWFTPEVARTDALSLYVDKKTKQVFTEPGKGREKLNVMLVPVSEDGTAPAAGVAPGAVPVSEKKSNQVSLTPNAASFPATAETKAWYDRLSVRGYTQFRSTFLDDHDQVKWYHPADRTVAPDQTFAIRRGRIILSGDVSEHLFMYVQPELFASPTDGDFSVQMRDLYGDVALDVDKEFRIRLGQSKVPYGFVNMQSSQNRAPLERPDALNSAVEGERDTGVFFYWAPKEIRQRFQALVKDGLKGSGDYGVIGVGAYNGQGLNRGDQNDNAHVVARASYPFKFESGQYFETGVQAYTGKFVPRTNDIMLPGSDVTTKPSFDADGITDQRAGVSAVLYPQPVGFEAEWNFGRGPELSDDFTRIEERSLQGGYILANMKIDSDHGAFFPFVRWQYYDGGRKFGKNAPSVNVNEFDAGIEFSPFKEFELTAMYTFTNQRTNSNDFPYGTLRDESRVGVQAQLNY